MSRIGRRSIALPAKVKVEQRGRLLVVEGPLGRLEAILPDGVSVVVDAASVSVGAPAATRANRGYQGLVRALLANMVRGVTAGYERTLEITGVGYEAKVEAKVMVLKLGYSHPIELALPPGVTVSVDKKDKYILKVKGIDKQLVGQVAAQIRSFKEPEPYKGKGVKYAEETIIRKVGKSGTK